MAIPTSTYRVQVSQGFDLYATAELTDYLDSLGVTHLYTSPLMAAVPGSPHGYDIVDYGSVDPERGGELGRQALIKALHQRGMGLVVDIVPNHCGVAVPKANPAWWSVLRYGRESPYAAWFDIDWTQGPVVLAVLDDSPTVRDELRLESSPDGMELVYREYRFPVAPGTQGGTPHDVLRRQHYRLVSWRAQSEVNYRRFFLETTLAALRIEDPEVFAATHELLIKWARDGELDGIRIDYINGLVDPATYLARLNKALPDDTWLIVEKVMAPGERLSANWQCAGTTGYDLMSLLSGVFIDPSSEAAFTALDTEVAGERVDWHEMTRNCKREAATAMLRAELLRLTILASSIVDSSVAADALAELLACYQVERVDPPENLAYVQEAAAQASELRPDLAAAIDALAPHLADPDDELALRFQQASGAVMGKGVGHRAFYRWSRFIALHEIGGQPAQFGTTAEDFHAACAERQAVWPKMMTTLSTHDTFRSEDVRSRLSVLSEIPDEWATTMRRWWEAAPMPDGPLAHQLWQTVAGAWPIERGRLHTYATKVMRSAAMHTSWHSPDAAFEKLIHEAIDRVYGEPSLRSDVDAFVEWIKPAGWVTSLSQKLVQLAMPGVPDVYQGTEIWDNSLVDPDNRRPLDFEHRRTLLAELDREFAEGLLPPVDDTGKAKLLVVTRTLRTRRDNPELFNSYSPINAEGSGATHVVSFNRGGAIAVATRLSMRLSRAGGWRNTILPIPPGPWTDVLTKTTHVGGEPVPVANLLTHFPVSLLIRQQ